MSSKIKKKINELALIIGHLYGDGGITNKGRVHYCNSEDFLIKEFIDSMRVFGIKPWIKEEQNITRVVYPVSVGRKIWSLFGKFSSGKDTKILTPEIEKMPLKWKARMLQAWFNDDGSVSNIPPNYKVIAIKQKLKHLIIFIKKTLEEFGITSKIIEDNGKWLLRIHGYRNIIKFRDYVNFSNGYRKRQELDLVLKTITRPNNITKDKILQSLKDPPKTINEISSMLNMNRNVIYCHLHGWKRKTRKSNKGLIDLGLVKVKKRGRKNIYSS